MSVAATPASPVWAGSFNRVMKQRDEGAAFTPWRRGVAATFLAVQLNGCGISLQPF